MSNYSFRQKEPPTEEEGCIRRGACCRSAPGWFAPQEMEKAAELLDMSPERFAATYLIIDGMELPELGRVELFAPLKLDRFGDPALPPVSRADDLYHYLEGPCIFFNEDDGCRIYQARPIECRRYFCGQDPEKNISHEEIAYMWANGKKSTE